MWVQVFISEDFWDEILFLNIEFSDFLNEKREWKIHLIFFGVLSGSPRKRIVIGAEVGEHVRVFHPTKNGKAGHPIGRKHEIIFLAVTGTAMYKLTSRVYF